MIWEKILALIILFLPLQLGRHFWPRSAFLFGLKIDYLSPVLYLQDIFIFFLVLDWFRKNIKNILTKKFFLAPRSLGVVGYFLFFIFNILYSLSPLSSFWSWLRISELSILAIIFSKNSRKVFHYLYSFLPFYVFLELFLSFWQVIKQSSVGGFFWLLGERTFNIFTPGISRGSFLGKVFLRPYGTFSHPNSLSGFILICLIFIFSKKKLNFLDKIAVIGGLLLIFLAFSRTVWFALIVLGLAYLLIRIKGNFLNKKLNFNFSYLVILLFLPLVVYLFSRTTMDLSSFTLRLKLANFALALIKQRPFFGVGLNNFVISLSQSNLAWEGLYWLQPVHNIFLLVGAETGLIGLSLFVGFIVLTMRRLLYRYIVILLYRKPKNEIMRYPASAEASAGRRDSDFENLPLSLMVALLAILFTGLFDHYWLTLIQNQLLFVLILALSWGV